MYQELIFFCRTFLAGVFLAVCYDVLRIIRRIIVHTSFWMGIEDIFYWCFTGVFLFLLYIGKIMALFEVMLFGDRIRCMDLLYRTW